jgi:hypothetical protein
MLSFAYCNQISFAQSDHIKWPALYFEQKECSTFLEKSFLAELFDEVVLKVSTQLKRHHSVKWKYRNSSFFHFQQNWDLRCTWVYNSGEWELATCLMSWGGGGGGPDVLHNSWALDHLKLQSDYFRFLGRCLMRLVKM